MITRFRKDLARRREEKIRFFFRAVGMHIRKRRKELNMTQEELADGICSNTYVSKMETNSIAVNEESLHLVMERMDMQYSIEMNIDDQIGLFERAIDAFLDGDEDALRRVRYEVRNVQFAILTDLCKMIADIVDGDIRAIERTSDNLSRYLDSMDHYTFGVFMFFAAAGMIAVGRPADAVEILEELESSEFGYLRFGPMFAYLKAVGYGRTQRYAAAYDALATAEAAFLRTHRFGRLAELAYYRQEFLFTQTGRWTEESETGYLRLLNGRFAARYHLLRAAAGIDPVGETERAEVEPAYRAAALFLRGRHLLGRGDVAGFRTTLEVLKTMKTPPPSLDFAGWLEVMEGGDEFALKDFLIAEVLPFAEAMTDVPLFRQTTDEIVGILVRRKRYKDALQYKFKWDRFIRTIAKTAGADMVTDAAEEPDSSAE